MPLKRLPTPNADAGNWGTILNEYINQLSPTPKGGINTWTTGTRPSSLTVDDEGRTGINTDTNVIERWSGSGWSTILGSSTGLTGKVAVAASTSNITLTGTQTIDGVALNAGDKVLLTSQTTASENGLYTVASGAWARSSDSSANNKNVPGETVYILSGNVNGNRTFALDNATSPVLGTDNVSYVVNDGTSIRNKTINARDNNITFFGARDNNLAMGAYCQDYNSGAFTMQSLEADLGITFDSQLVFRALSAYDTSILAASRYQNDIKSKLDIGKEIYYTVEMNNPTTGVNNLADIRNTVLTNGSYYNTSLSNLFNEIKKDGRKINLTLFHEINLNGYDWAAYRAGNNPADFIPAYRNVYTLAQQLGVTSYINFGLQILPRNQSDDTTYPLDYWLVGNEDFIDYIGFSIYNKGDSFSQAFRPFTAIFHEGYREMKKFGKRIIISEGSSFPQGCINQYIISGTQSGAYTGSLTGTITSPVTGMDAAYTLTLNGSGIVTGVTVTKGGGYITSASAINLSNGAIITPVVSFPNANRAEWYYNTIVNAKQFYPLLCNWNWFFDINQMYYRPYIQSEKNAFAQAVNFIRSRQDISPAQTIRPIRENKIATPNLLSTWTTNGSNVGTLATNTDVPAEAYSAGANSLTLTHNGTSGSYPTNLIYRTLPATAYTSGKSGVISFWAKSSVAGLKLSTLLQQNDGSFNLASNGLPITLSTEWKQYYVYFGGSTQPGTTGWRLRMAIGQNTIAATLFLYDVALFDGEYPSPTNVTTVDGTQSISGKKSFLSTATSATLQLASGTNPTTPVAGDLWNDSTQKALSGFYSGITQRFVGTLFTQTANTTIANTTTESTLFGAGIGTSLLPANFFQTGKTIRLELCGLMSTDASAGTMQVNIKLGSTSIISTGNITLPNSQNNVYFTINAIITCRSIGATGAFQGGGTWVYGDTTLTNQMHTIGISSVGTAAVDTTVTQQPAITVTWGTASANNTITATNLIFTALN